MDNNSAITASSMTSAYDNHSVKGTGHYKGKYDGKYDGKYEKNEHEKNESETKESWAIDWELTRMLREGFNTGIDLTSITRSFAIIWRNKGAHYRSMYNAVAVTMNG